MSRILKLMATVALAFSATSAHAADPAAKCAAAKQKAAVKKIASFLKCEDKRIGKPTFDVAGCDSDAEDKFNAAIAKAESKGGCVVTGDAAAIESASITCVQSLLRLTPVLCGDSPYPQCGGTCPTGTVCRAFIVQDSRCEGLDPTCQTSCQCVDPAAACNGAACDQICSVQRGCENMQDVVESATCCGGAGAACVVGSGGPSCCCAGSCQQPVGSIGSCLQGITCNANRDGEMCQ
jgi:hypothetical protein